MKLKTVNLAASTSFLSVAALAFLGAIPGVTAIVLGGFANIFALLAVVLKGTAMFFHNTSDEPSERVIWGLIGLGILSTIAWLAFSNAGAIGSSMRFILYAALGLGVLYAVASVITTKSK